MANFYRGLSVVQIAHALKISDKTVFTQKYVMMQKFNLRTVPLHHSANKGNQFKISSQIKLLHHHILLRKNGFIADLQRMRDLHYR